MSKSDERMIYVPKYSFRRNNINNIDYSFTELLDRGEYLLFHSTFSDGQTAVTDVETITDDSLVGATITSSKQFMGRTGDPILVRKPNQILIGLLDSPVVD